jgi:acyl carrier protein
MPMSDRLERLNQVFRDVFDDDELDITRRTTANDVEGWDSLMHVTSPPSRMSAS